LSKGIVSGFWGAADAVVQLKLHELTKTAVLDPGTSCSNTYYVFMNKKKWESLPKDVRDIIDGVNEEWATKVSVERHNQEFKVSYEAYAKAGVTIVKASEADAAKTISTMKPLFDNYIKKVTAQGLPGVEIVKFCQDYIKTH
jgi:TRAP-type C4-dicarboxylate transport system substrate-binding protein